MWLRLFIAILMLSKSTAFAAVSCDALLAQAGQATSAITEGLSSSARVYVNLVQHYIKQQGAKADSITNQILNSDEFVNPFAGLTGSHEVQMAAAIRKVSTQIDSQDWVQIKVAIGALVKTTAVQDQDRSENQVSESVLVNPKVRKVRIDPLNPFIDPRKNWVFENGRNLSAETFTSRIRVYEEINGNKQLIAEAGPNAYGYASIQNIGKRTFVVALSRSFGPTKIYVHELIGSTLSEVASIEIDEDDIGSSYWLEWTVLKSRAFISLKNKNGLLNIHEFNGLNLKAMPLPKSQKNNSTSSLHLIGDRILLGYGEKGKEFKIFEFIDDKFKFLDLNYASEYVESAPAWHSVGDRTFVAISSRDTNVQIFELVGDKLVLTTSQKIFPNNFMTGSNLFWHEIGGRHFLAFLFSQHLYVYEFMNEQLELMTTFDIDTQFEAAVKDSFYKDESLHLRVVDQNYRVNYIDLFKKVSKSRGGK